MPHLIHIREAKTLIGNVVFGAGCTCGWSRDGWHHADEFDDPDPAGRARAAADRAGAAHEREANRKAAPDAAYAAALEGSR